ncbi:MAG: 2-hydroxymuconic semialdehyde dehydrogenase [Gammaproteobacteria bacterium]|nr:2-hydroxymuconic semialdehyde dehydrogenase [Gammaproteobacteria bacterium]
MKPETLRFFIDGEFVAASNQQLFANTNPVDGSLISHVPEATGADVDHAVQAARRALSGPWSTLSADERCRLLHRVANIIDRRFEDFLKAEVTDTGKPVSVASTIDIPRGAANFRVFADMVKSMADESFHTPTPDGTGAMNYTVRKPKGVIAVICPWNLPFLLMTWKVGPALACGNTMVVKPSEETPTTATLLGEVMLEAGVPPGVFNVIHGFGPDSAGEYLVRHNDISAVTFTGETRTGTAIMGLVAEGIKDVSFELGGKNPAIVCADCDFDKAIEGTQRSVFANCGQICLGTERVYVERSLFERLVNALKERAESLVMGDPFDPSTSLGPLISLEHRDKVLHYYEDAALQGAEVVTGGGTAELDRRYAAGSWVQPTIWTGLPEESSVNREEIFGPCCHIRPFDAVEEAIALANDTDYGLAATVWTQDVSKANYVATHIESGICWVNCWFLRDLRTPFGGTKKSGIGREGGHYSFEFYSEIQNVCVKF